MRPELQELKELLQLLADAEKEFRFKLECIDKLLGAPYAKDFPEATVAAIVEDVLQYTMMLNDINKFVTRRISDEIRDIVFSSVFKHAEESIKHTKS